MENRSKQQAAELRKQLALSDAELLSNWTRLAKLIRLYEGIDWNDAKQKALELVEEDTAFGYIQNAREQIIPLTIEEIEQPKPTEEKPQQPVEIKPLKLNLPELPELNFQALVELAPDLADSLTSRKHYFALARKRGHRSVSLEWLKEDQKGYYLQINAYTYRQKDGVDTSHMIFLDLKNNIVESLSYTDAKGITTQVYKNPYKREMVKTTERKEQNELLHALLDKLLGVGMSFEIAKSPAEKEHIKNQKFQKRQKEEEAFRDTINEQIPEFEPGHVKLTEAHKRAGLKQKDINILNKHQRGLVFIPRKKVQNNTIDLEKDLKRKAMLPGFRLSKTGKIYYEARSNRTDLTDGGL